MTQAVAVLGVDTPIGGELVRLLDGHPGLALDYLGCVARAGSSVGEVHPHLADGRRLLFPADVNLMPPLDAAFLCLAAGEADKASVQLLERGVKVLNVGADEGPPAEGWAYGLGELNEVEIGITARLAVPSAVGAGAVLAVVPTLNEGLIAPDPLTLAVGGPPVSREALAEEVEEALAAATGAAINVTARAEERAGRMAAVTLQAAAPDTDAAELMGTTASAYAGFATVSVGGPPGDWTIGSARVSIGVEMDVRVGLATFHVRMDALARRAGMAIGAANLMLGRAEHEGVPLAGLGDLP